MLALSTTGTAINNSGNTTITAPTCIFYSDSASSNSAAAGGSSAVTAKAIAGVGGIQNSNNWNVQQYLPYSPSLPDPFAPPSATAVTPDPSDMHCAVSSSTKHGVTTYTPLDRNRRHGHHDDEGRERQSGQLLQLAVGWI